MADETLIRARSGVGLRVFMTLLLVAGGGFFLAMAALVSHDSALECASRTSCHHVERYPFGVVMQKALAPLQRADVKWSPGSRSAALKVVVSHEDGTKSEYHGVGQNGDRAEDTAEALNTYLSSGEGAKSFALREGSMPVAVLLLVFGVTALVLVSYFFSRVRLRRSNEVVEIAVERWPARPARCTVALAERAEVAIVERVVNGRQFFSLWLERQAGPRFDLGLSFPNAEAATREQTVVAALFR